jgi:hypothetical protein
MVWIELESFLLGSPSFADELVWCEAFECLEPTSKIIGVHEVAQMSSQLIVTVVVVALDGSLLDSPVHPLHLTIGPRMFGLGQSMLDTMLTAELVEAMNPKAGRPAIAIARQIGECLIPGFDGAFLSNDWTEALWAKFFTGAPPRQRRSVERYKIVKRA